MRPHKDKVYIHNSIETVASCLCIVFSVCFQEVRSREAKIHVAKLIKLSSYTICVFLQSSLLLVVIPLSKTAAD